MNLNKPYIRRSLIIAGMLEGVLLSLGIGTIYLAGGVGDFGGSIFLILHLPGSLILAYLFSFFQMDGSSADVIFILFSTALQFALFAAIVYWVQVLFKKT